LVRLKFEDVDKVKKKRKPKAPKNKVADKEGSDFDSEKEYGSEGAANESEEGSYVMDDGRTPLVGEIEEFDEDDEMMSEGGEDDMEEMGDDELSESEASESEEVPVDNFDKYTIDPLLVRREATLLTLVKRGFRERCIVFFNEKKQC